MPKVQSTTAVRPQIKNMVSPGTDEEFTKTLPMTTAETPAEGGEEKTVRRKRRTKEEMAASRAASDATAEIDPLMTDSRYAAIVNEMAGMGGKEILSLGYRATGKPLDAAEQKRADDVFYVMAKKGNFNPAQSWIALILYFLAINLQFALARTDVVEKLKSLFEKVGEQPAPKSEVKKESPDAPIS